MSTEPDEMEMMGDYDGAEEVLRDRGERRRLQDIYDRQDREERERKEREKRNNRKRK